MTLPRSDLPWYPTPQGASKSKTFVAELHEARIVVAMTIHDGKLNRSKSLTTWCSTSMMA